MTLDEAASFMTCPAFCIRCSTSSGLHELKDGKHAAAECRLQTAVALCPDEHAALWTALRDGLAGDSNELKREP